MNNLIKEVKRCGVSYQGNAAPAEMNSSHEDMTLTDIQLYKIKDFQEVKYQKYSVKYLKIII